MCATVALRLWQTYYDVFFIQAIPAIQILGFACDLMSSVRRKQGDNFGFIDYIAIPYSSTSTCLWWWWQLISVNIWKFYLLLSISDMVSYRKASLPYKNHLDWLLGWMAVFYFWAARQRTRKSTAKEGYRRNVENQIAFMIKLITF